MQVVAVGMMIWLVLAVLALLDNLLWEAEEALRRWADSWANRSI